MKELLAFLNRGVYNLVVASPPQQKLNRDIALTDPPKILILDPSRRRARPMAAFFKNVGITTLTAIDGNVGLAIAIAKRPDVIISDWRLPSRSVFLVLEYLRLNTEFDGVVVITTANPACRHRRYAKMLGVQAVVPNSIEFDELLFLVYELLDQNSARKMSASHS